MTDPGLFGPESAAWELCRERAVVAFAPRAVLLQYAHPAFAAASRHYAVAGRYERALRTLSDIVFADRRTALGHADRVGAMHQRLRGTHPDGTAWSATDPAALAWVLVTLLDATVRGAELVRGPLPALRVDRFLAEARVFGRLFGVAEAEVPDDRAALDRAVDRAVRETLVIGPEVRELWRDLLAGAGASRPLWARWIAATLPPPIAAALGARSRFTRAVVRGAGLSRAGRLLPGRVRYTSRYRARSAELGG